MAIAIALELLGSVAVLLVSTQQITRFFHLVDAGISPSATSRGLERHVYLPKNARSTRRERRIHPTPSLLT
ncbi:MAG: hypothetical protein WA359_01115 [Acidimicrobiales bacterium]